MWPLKPNHELISILNLGSAMPRSDHSGSRDVISHVTVRIPLGHFLLVVHWTQVSISIRFRDIWRQAYWGHDLDFSGSRDVIIDVTIRIPMDHFLFVVHWTQVYFKPFSRYLALSIIIEVTTLTFLGHVTSSERNDCFISHVTIRIPMGHFLLVVYWTQVSISSRFRDIWP